MSVSSRLGIPLVWVATLLCSVALTARAGARCEDIQSLKRDATTITLAETVAAGAFVPPERSPWSTGQEYAQLPAFCRVAGSLHPTPDSQIGFELWMPVTGWNGKFLQAGNGGAAGSIVYPALVVPLSRGYAVVHTDTGHSGGGGDFSWAVGHPEKVTDFAYRAVHEVTLAGKAMTREYYGERPRLSYWLGCSTGGRQGYVEAQRYPDDYDGVAAGAPAANWIPTGLLAVLFQRELLSPDGLPVSNLALLRRAAVAACDAAVGVVDGVISDPDRCRFDPKALLCSAAGTDACLTAPEVAAAQRLYRGVVDGRRRVVYPGTGPGSEIQWAAFVNPDFRIGESAFRYLVYNDPEWSVSAFNVDRDLAAGIQRDAGAASAMDPNLRSFLNHGGKLLTYHGTTDGLIPYLNTRHYVLAVQHSVGSAAATGVRYYEVPGMDHCGGGAGAGDIDWLSALDTWVETGRAPEALPAHHPGEGESPSFSRPQCPFPQQARYRGHGDPRDAQSFACVKR